MERGLTTDLSARRYIVIEVDEFDATAALVSILVALNRDGSYDALHDGPGNHVIRLVAAAAARNVVPIRPGI